MAKEDFNFDFDPWMVEELLVGNNDHAEWYEAMLEVLPTKDITSIERVAGFIAQCGHESRNFNVLTENLNYSASALNKRFSKYFVKAGRDPQPYHRKPEMIANVIYANRMENGDTQSGDGWYFRGGGILQLTGRQNYTNFGESIGMSAEDATDYVRTKKGALASACWFWQTNKVNRYCDNQDIVGMSKRINGGRIGLEDRKKHYIHALDVLGGDFEEPSLDLNVTLRKGSRGAVVAALQEKLNIHADGVFGPGTERNVKKWQKANGLVVDGIAGPRTLGLLLG